MHRIVTNTGLVNKRLRSYISDIVRLRHTYHHPGHHNKNTENLKTRRPEKVTHHCFIKHLRRAVMPTSGSWPPRRALRSFPNSHAAASTNASTRLLRFFELGISHFRFLVRPVSIGDGRGMKSRGYMLRLMYSQICCILHMVYLREPRGSL